jgi:hypothetical protein
MTELEKKICEAVCQRVGECLHIEESCPMDAVKTLIQSERREAVESFAKFISFRWGWDGMTDVIKQWEEGKR